MYYFQAGSLVLLTFLTQLVHSLGFVKHAPAAGSVTGPAKAVAGAAIVLGTASAAGGLAPRAVMPYVNRVIVPLGKGPLQQASTAGSRLLSSGPWTKK